MHRNVAFMTLSCKKLMCYVDIVSVTNPEMSIIDFYDDAEKKSGW